MKNIFSFGLILIILNTKFLFAQEKVKKSESIGYQLGYSYSRISKIELGANLYWAKRIMKNDTYHTFGPFINAAGMWSNKIFYVGKQFGFNYHYGYGIALRISPAYEENFHHDNRIGCDFGVSCLGLLLHAGYYYPVGKTELSEISRWRIGIRLIINLASSDIAPDIG